MTRQQAVKLIRTTKGLIFSVSFVKRTTGEVRDMVCRQGVKKYLKGGPAAYNFSSKGLISVFDMQKVQYRCIPIEGLQKVSVYGKTFQVQE